jgi:hypothetical protein
MKKNRVRWIHLVVLSLVAILIAASARLPARADAGSPSEMVQRAWRNAQAAGSYRFISDVSETLAPRPLPEMIGQRDTTIDLALDGAVQLPDRSYISLQVIGNGRSGSVALLRDGAQSFMLQDGALKPVEDALSLATPSNDLLGYLSAAENVTVIAPPEDHPELVRYSFELSGTRFEEYVRQQTEAALRAEPGAPEGLALKASPSLQRTSGHGELWVNADGLPVRQVLDVDMPEVNAQYSARIHMVIDFSAHGQVETLPHAVQGSDGTWHVEGALTTHPRKNPASSSIAPLAAAGAQVDHATQAVTSAAAGWSARLSAILPVRIAPDSLVLFILLVLAIAIVRYYRRNPGRCSTLIVSILIAAMVLSPLLQAGKVVRFEDRQAQAAEARQAATPDLLHALGLETASPDAGSTAQAKAKGDNTMGTGAPEGDPVPTPAVGFDLPSPSGPASVSKNNAIARAQEGESTSALLRCGDGEPGVDSDGDGLTDQVELCLGTSPYKADTDGDSIPDKTELDGFDCYGKHWASDPLSVDSNGDGALDTMEWSETLTANGQAISVDDDMDGTPNLWDEDDDGDGVPDAQDLSPFARSEYTTDLSLSTEGDGFTGYEYIEIQVQPQEPDHLRYSTTALDWPYDDQGNVQDLDLSREDLRLTPFLLVTTNVAPPADLAQKYGVASWQVGDEYVLLVTLQPMGDGGAVSSFYAKVAYGPGQTADIQWQANMVWMAQMQADVMLYPYFRVFKTEMHVLHQYQDSFRLTGLKVTKERGYEAAVLGTPAQVDDLSLFRILLGLNDTFKSHLRMEGQEPGETALQEVAQRFAPGSTADLVHTFGVEPSAVAVSGPTEYGHTDAALAGIGAELVPDFLDSYDVFYGRTRCADAEGNPVSCATLILAYEQSLGVRDLQGLPSIAMDVVNLAQLHVNLGTVPLVTNRGLQMRMYEQGTDGWQMVTPARMLELVEARYAGTYDTALRDLYPNLQTNDLRFITYTAYLWATSPCYAAIAVDGQPVVPDVPDEAQLALNRALSPEEEAQVETAIDWFALGTGLASALGTSAVFYVWAFSDFSTLLNDLLFKQNFGLGWKIWGGVGVGLFLAATTASTIMSIINAVCTAESDSPMCRNEAALKGANIAANALAIVYQAQWVTQMIIDGFRGTLEAVSKLALSVQAVGMVVGILLAWASFGMVFATSGGDPIAWRVALAGAIMTTIWLIFLFALNFIPIVGQIISAILALIDMLLSFFTGLFGDKQWSIVTVILGFLWDIRVLTTLQDAAFGEPRSSLEDPNLGLVGGNTFRLSIPASGVMGLVDYGYSVPSDLDDSWAEGRMTWQWPKYDPSTMFTATDESQPRHCVHSYVVEQEWNNTVTLAYALTPKINGVVSYSPRIVYQYVWGNFACYNTVRYNSKTAQATAPEDADDTAPSKMYLDVLPSNLTDLWNWSALTNPDHDGDGLTNEQEAALGTDPYKWDTDGDGLSDYYEWLTSADYAADPLLADTDGDGLNDGLEWRLGTRIDVADTDGDGLSDGEEVRRLEGGVMVGGWQVTLPGLGTVWVSSDPLQPDTEGDGLNDAEEKAHGLSPHAINSPVPALSLRGAPIRGLPGGRAGTYWETGETVSFAIRLANYASDPVTTTLTLGLPAWLYDIQGGTMQGDRTPPLVKSGGQLSWSFTGPNALQVYEVVSTTVTARVSATSASDQIDLSLPYGDVELRKTLHAVVDGDNPNVSVQVPANGAFLRGATLVVGGSATDPTTWVTGAELSIVPQGNAPSFQPLSGSLSPWAYSWSLPADGVYTLQARATDAMGHQSTTDAVNVTVDNTKPTATLSFEMEGSTVHLSGTATDNLSGVQWVQLSLDGQPWRSVTLNGSAWSYDWTVGVGAQGTHEAKLLAFDRSGNQSDIISQEIVIDSVAPSSEVSGGADPDVPPAVKPNTAFTLSGVADEGGHLPLPAVPPDLRTGMDVFDDSTVWLGLSSIRDNDGGVLATWIGDFDADRMADLAVGLPGPSGDAGLVVVLYGRAGGWSVPPDLEMLATSPTRFLGAAGVQLGSYLAAAGDTNGDNFYDLLIGERASTRAFLIFGHPGALGGVTLDGGHTGYRTVLQAPATIQGLATAGDVNGDGWADLLIRAGGTAYLVFGRPSPWPETVDVAAEAAATFSGVTGALGVGDVNDDQLAEWVTMGPNQVKVYHWNDSSGTVELVSTVPTADAAPRVVALGDVDGDGRADWLYSNGTSRTLIYGSGASPHTFSGYDGLFAAPGDIDGDGRADILLADAGGLASLVRQQAGGSPEVFATVSGVGGAANAPYAAGADLNADGSAELLLIPSQAAAEARGFDAPDFSSGFISPQALPLGVSSGSAGDAVAERLKPSLQASLLSIGPDTRYVDDDYCSSCANDGHTWGSDAFATVQSAVNASDGGGDTIIVYPGVYAPFSVPAGANYDHLTVQGVSPDAVFVDGATSDAIHVAADGVHLSNLTVRNATAGIVLEAGAGEPTVAGGSETFVNHVVAHSVQYPIWMTQASALTLSDSTLVGNGTDPLIRVDSTLNPAVYTWHEDRAVATPATPSMQPLTKNGGPAAAVGTLYAMPGGTDRTVYAATPGTDGALGPWSAAFQVPHPMPADPGKSMITAGGGYFYQIQTAFKAPDFGVSDGEIHALATAANGDVYAGGSFTQIGGVDANNIARWDGTQWNRLGTMLSNGVDGTVYALTILSNGDLYVGGHFSRVFDGTEVPALNIARWNGSAWLTLGDPVAGGNGVSGNVYIGLPEEDVTVYALTHTDDDVVAVGGRFRSCHDAQGSAADCTNFAFYVPTVSSPLYGWQPSTDHLHGVGDYYDAGCYVSSLVWGGGTWWGTTSPSSAPGKLYAGGSFASAGYYAANNIGVFQYNSGAGGMEMWHPIGSGIATAVADVARDTAGKIYAVSDDAAADGVYVWDGSAWSWTWTVLGPGGALAADTRGNVYAAMFDGKVYVLPNGWSSAGDLGNEATRVWDLLVESPGQVLAARGDATSGGVRRWVVDGLLRRDLSAGSWEWRSSPDPTANYYMRYLPLGLAVDDSGNVYGVWAQFAMSRLWRFDATSKTWMLRANPDANFAFSGLVWAGGKLYSLAHSDADSGEVWYLYQYDPASNVWTQIGQAPLPNGASSGNNLSLTWDGADGIYALTASGFYRYRIGDNAWDTLPAPSVSFTISQAPALARVGSYLYVYATPGTGVTTNLFRYGAVGTPDLRLTVDRTAFVVPDAATSFAWTNLSTATGTYRFRTDIDTSNAWVGPSSASWSPTLPTGATTLTSTQAAFVAPEDGLYRVGADSSLSAGYHQYKAVAHVYTSQGACAECSSGSLTWGDTAFATIREAVESGAARVLVHPGRYPQAFYLVSGVDVIGSGAETTIIEPPAGTAATLVTAEGVAGSSLSRVTLAGSAGWQGFLAEGGAKGLTFSRNIIRDLSTGVRLRGGSEVELVNNTIVRNGTGFLAEGDNPVNVRNTIFAYNTGTGLQRGASPTSLANVYNDFWGNGIQMSPSEAGGGKLFRDPRFRNLSADDLRLAADSPLIDMGAPSDPTPPGAGTRVDMGYAEYNAASFYVSPDYSETGLNDGLLWGVDAFDTVQAGLDAAAAALHGLQGALPEGGYSVGVDEGTFAERVTVPSHVRLVGSGAAVTTIDANNAGSAVTFDAVTDAEVSGMTLQHASAAGAGVDIKNWSSGISIARNVIVNNAGHGVSLAASSSAALEFDTIVSNIGAGVHASGAGTWADVRNSILDSNALGLQATSSGLIRNDYNLLHNTTDLDGVTAGPNTIYGAPAFAGTGHYVPTAASPAIDAADPLAEVPPAGGVRADLGYKELVASPLNLLFGPQIESTVTGNSGVAKVEVGVTLVGDPTQPVTATLPSTWQTLTPATTGQPLFFWSQSLSQSTPGYYRVYSRATDVAGNTEEDESDWYEGAFVVDNTAPTIAWGTPALPSSTDAAAVLAVAEASGTVTTGTGTRSDVRQVYFSVPGPSGSVTYPAQGGRAWIRLPVAASYAIIAVAVDEAGNEAQTVAGVNVSASGSVATVSDPPDGSAVADTAVTLRGYVRFVGSGTGVVNVSVSGGGTVQAALESPGAAFSAWSAAITLPAVEGVKTVTITPTVGGTAGVVTTLSLTLDTTAPSLSVTTPVAGTVVTQTVTFAGSASDAGGGVAEVEVSLDGGFTWQQADLSSGNWSLSHTFDPLQDYVSYPARIRAIDAAGNVTVVDRRVVVDSVPPTGLPPVTFDQPVGQHLDIGSSLSISWNVPVDAGGPVQVLLAVDQVSTTVPSGLASGTSSSATLNVVGDWYVHLMAQDAIGNQALYHYGPWHVRDMVNATFSARRQSIIVDGFIDLDHNEWLAGDLLGTDTQGLETQQLYASWDGQAIYLGWSGAWWTLDGAMWAYLDVATGGSTQSVGGAQTLPIAADVAVWIDSPQTGSLYTWNGSIWALSASPLDFSQGSSGDSEARIPYSLAADQTVQLVAFALPREEPVAAQAAGDARARIADDDAGQPWVIFPNTNPLGEPPAESYLWAGLEDVINMNDGQPTARTVTMQVSSPQAGGVAQCPESTLRYEILLQNAEPSAIAGLTLVLTPTAGLNYASVSGATYVSTPGVWTFSVPTIAAGGSQNVVVSAKLASDLSAITAVTTSMRLSAGSTPLTGPPVAKLSHQVDGQAPTVTLDSLPGGAIAPGSYLFTGKADDGAGSGVALVSVSVDGGVTWLPAAGTLAWSALLATPASGTFTLKARAVDRCGHIGPVVTQVYNVDNTNPQISWTVPGVITTSLALLSGTTWDPAPVGAQVAHVDVQLDSAAAAWLAAAGPSQPQNGVQLWRWTWNTPQDDGVTHTLRAQAVDGVGKLADTGWQTTVVDVVAPQITVTTHLEAAVLPDDPPAVAESVGQSLGQGAESDGPARWPSLSVLSSNSQVPLPATALAFTPILTGTVSDGAGVQAVRILVYDPLGGTFIREASLAGGVWEYAPDLAGWAVGSYALRVQAVDVHGNTSLKGPYLLDVQDAQITDLTATNSGPRQVGQTVALSATITGGSNVTYAWALGDGGAASGPVVTHAYAGEGIYTAIVTATNSASSSSAQTTVTIMALSVEAGPNQSAKEGDTVLIAATFSGGYEGVTYTASIDWGDSITPTTGIVDAATSTISGSHAYGDNGTYTVTVTLQAEGGVTASDTLQVTVSNVAPAVSAAPATQTVQYGHPIATITITATDVASDTMTAALTSAPASLVLGSSSCSTSASLRTCTWQVTGNPIVISNTYTVRVTATDKDLGSSYADASVTVRPENATVSFADANPVAVKVPVPSGSSGPFELKVCVQDADPTTPGDISLAQLSMTLGPVGPGSPISGTASGQTVANGLKCVTFGFNGMPVNVYSVQVTVAGGYYVGAGEGVLVVYDPSLGFTTGGGWFYWPNTANAETGYPGDVTTFAYILLKYYAKRVWQVQGKLLLTRHLADGSFYRIRSNTLYGLALGQDRTVPMGWAAFSGNGSYQEPGWRKAIGGYAFTVYVEDRNTPGKGTDRFWIEVAGGLSLPRAATANAVPLAGGNLIVPHSPH